VKHAILRVSKTPFSEIIDHLNKTPTNSCRGFMIELQDLLASGRIMGLRKTEIDSIISDVRTSLSKWEQFAGNAGLPEQIAGRISKQFEIL
jgi:hypothetical protein